MDDNYLIPANTKKGQLIFGVFYPIDLIIFLTGVGITFILLAILNLNNWVMAILAIVPGMVAGFLVLPVAYYHNIRQLVTEIIKFVFNRKEYEWKGWCFKDESNNEPDKSNSTEQMDRRLDKYSIYH